MKYIGFGIHLKFEIYIKDILNVIRLVGLAKKSKKRRVHISYCKIIIETLTTVKKARFWHPFLLNRVLKVAGMIANKVEKAESEKQLIKRINDMVFYIAPRVGMTPDQFMSNLQGDDLQQYYDNVERIKLDDGRSRVLAHHLPKDYYDEITEGYKRIRDRIKKLESDTVKIKKQIKRIDPGRIFSLSMV